MTAPRILLMIPRVIFESWPIPTDFHRYLKRSLGTTLAQLAAAVPEFPCDLFDGNATSISMPAYLDLLRGHEIIGVSVVSSAMALNCEITVRLIREVNPGATIIVGGHHATFHHLEWLERGADVVVRREGEQSFREVALALARGESLEGIQGITYRGSAGPVVAPERSFAEDLDALPPPCWDGVPFLAYRFNLGGTGGTASVETSRGCDHGCLFCLAGAMWHHRQRYKSVERVVQEVRDLRGRGITDIAITDDNFGGNYPRDRALLRSLIDADLDLRLWMFIRADTLLRHPDLVDLSARAGLREVIIGFESLDDDTLRGLNKGVEGEVSLALLQQLYRRLKAHGVLVYGAFLEDDLTGEEIGQAGHAGLQASVCDLPMTQSIIPMKGIAGYDQLQRNTGLAVDPFYHDRYIPPLPRRRRLASRLRPLSSLVNRNVFEILAGGDSRQRREVLHLYASILGCMARVTPRKLVNHFISTWPSGGAPAERYARLVWLNTSREYIRGLAGG